MAGHPVQHGLQKSIVVAGGWGCCGWETEALEGGRVVQVYDPFEGRNGQGLGMARVRLGSQVCAENIPWRVMPLSEADSK